MTNDPFLAIKAQLDGIAKHNSQQEERLIGVISILRTGCTEIAALKADEQGNGLRLAIELAERALRDTQDWP